MGEWADARLGDVVTPRGEKRSPDRIDEMPFIGLEHVESYTGRIVGAGTTKTLKSAVALFNEGDLLYGRLRPYLNKVIVAPLDGAASAEFIVIPPSESCSARFLRHRLRAPDFLEFTSTLDRGDRPRVTWEQIANFRLRLPDKHAPELLSSKFDSLLERVGRAEREITQADKANSRLQHLILDEALKPLLEAKSISLGKRATQVTSGSRGWSKFYGHGSSVFVLAANVRPMRFDPASYQLVDAPVDTAEARRTRIAKDDILITIVGAKTGDVCRVDQELSNHYVCQSVAKVRFESAATARLVELFLNAESLGRAQLMSRLYGQGRPHLSFDDIKALQIPDLSDEEAFPVLAAVDRTVERLARLRTEAGRAGNVLAKLEGKLYAEVIGAEPGS